MELPDECWRWPGRRRDSRKDGRAIHATKYVYRQMYLMLIDPDLPPDLQLHHTCHHPWCVNPWHLEPKTPEEHAALHAPPGRPRKDTCVNGHDLTDPANIATTVRQSGPRAGKTERHCRECMNDWKRRHRHEAL